MARTIRPAQAPLISASLGIDLPEEGLTSFGQLSTKDQKSVKSLAEEMARNEAVERFVDDLVAQADVVVGAEAQRS